MFDFIHVLGISDICKCFFCGGEWHNWRSDHDPWKEHARWSPQCGFLKLKGEEYIQAIQDPLAQVWCLDCLAELQLHCHDSHAVNQAYNLYCAISTSVIMVQKGVQ